MHLTAIPKLLSLLGPLLFCTAIGCFNDPVSESFDPTWIAASWTGGAVGEPNDRTDTPADEWNGQLCPPESVLLTNHDGFAGLTIVNNCASMMTYGICIDKGSLTQPENGLEECAEDPFETPLSDLKIQYLNPGEPGISINATGILSVNIFFCSNEDTLTGEPVECLGLVD